MPQIYDLRPTALFPLRRKVCWGFFLPKNPTASARFEPANLGTKGQKYHRSGVIPKSLSQSLKRLKLNPNTYIQMPKSVILGTCCSVKIFKIQIRTTSLNMLITLPQDRWKSASQSGEVRKPEYNNNNNNNNNAFPVWTTFIALHTH